MLFRAFSNSFYWSVNSHLDDSARNLGYISKIQTTLSNVYRSQVVDWLTSTTDAKYIESIAPYLETSTLDYATKLFTKTRTPGVIELYVLSIINDIQINVLDRNYAPIYVFSPEKGIVYDMYRNSNPYRLTDYSGVNILFGRTDSLHIPEEISAIYHVN